MKPIDKALKGSKLETFQEIKLRRQRLQELYPLANKPRLGLGAGFFSSEQDEQEYQEIDRLECEIVELKLGKKLSDLVGKEIFSSVEKVALSAVMRSLRYAEENPNKIRAIARDRSKKTSRKWVIKQAAKRWETGDKAGTGQMAKALRADLKRANMYAPKTDKTVREWIVQAESMGKLCIPKHAKRHGRRPD